MEVLRVLQRRRTQIAVVVDEHGGMAGILTLEDLLEELVGDIVSESEEPRKAVHREPDGTAVVRGDTPVREVNRALGLNLEEGSDYTTVGGLCMALSGALPEPGTKLKTPDGTLLEVLDASARAVWRVRVTPPANPPKAP